MKPAPFDYRRVRSVGEAVELLAAPERLNRLLAGGQSLVPMLNLRLAPVDCLIDISKIEELRASRDAGSSIVYGACVTHAAFEDARVPDASNGLMRHMAERIAYRAVRNRGTLGGALALADPSADWLAATVLLQATFTLIGASGRRRVAAADFFIGPYMTAAQEQEILVDISIPKRPAHERWGYAKVTRKAGEYASSLALALFDAKSGAGRVAAGAVDGAPLVLEQVAQAMKSRPDDRALRALAEAALDQSGRPFSAAKRHMHATTIVRAVRQALQ
jgi:carbon-monoxide dehydrogenase medium subunit